MLVVNTSVDSPDVDDHINPVVRDTESANGVDTEDPSNSDFMDTESIFDDIMCTELKTCTEDDCFTVDLKRALVVAITGNSSDSTSDMDIRASTDSSEGKTKTDEYVLSKTVSEGIVRRKTLSELKLDACCNAIEDCTNTVWIVECCIAVESAVRITAETEPGLIPVNTLGKCSEDVELNITLVSEVSITTVDCKFSTVPVYVGLIDDLISSII